MHQGDDQMNKSFIAILTLVIASAFFAANGAKAQVNAWYSCTTKSNAAVTMMLPAAQARAYMGQGWRCNMLDIDYASSKGRACYLLKALPGRTWYEYLPSTGGTVLMSC